jgi:predicted dehydrogenase
MNRRHLLRAALPASMMAARPLPGIAAASTEPRRIPIGLLGASHSHAPGKLKVLRASDDFEVVGVSEDDTTARREVARLGVDLVAPEELFERSRVIAVEGPVRDHARHALAALRAGKHVHVEKPPATNLRDMQELTALAGAKGLLLQSGYMWRHHPGIAAIIEAAHRGWLGPVVMVRASIVNNLGAEERRAWGEFPGGAMFELGAHLVDAVVRLLGKPSKVTPFLRHHGRFEDRLNDNNVAVLEYEGAVAIITNTAMQGAATPARAFEVIGTDGSAVLQPIEPPELKLDLTRAAGPYKHGLQSIPLTYRRYEADFVELAAAVREERKLGVTLEQELLVQQVLLEASGMS